MQKPSRIRRVSRFVLFRLVPLLLVIGIVWYGVQIAQNLLRVVNEQAQYEQRKPLYAGTATAIASAAPVESALRPDLPTPFFVAQAGWGDLPLFAADESLSPTPYMISQFVTNTPQGESAPAFATNTPDAPVDQPVESTPVPDEPEATIDSAQFDVTPRPLPTVMFLGDPEPGQEDVTAIPPRLEPIDRQGYDLMNILLLGTDEELSNDNFRRTDTMIVLSINRSTGTVAMLSLPRDMFVYIPAWGMQRLNLAWARGENGGWVDGPFELIRQTILYNFGINVHYYALIDLSGFTEAIDLVGGVDVAVDCAIQNLPLIGAEVPAAARRINEDGEYVLDVGEYTLTGAEALWYARARDNSSDFDRGRRQQQILRAVWRKALDSGQITSNLANLPELWNSASEIVETNLRFEDIVGLIPTALTLNPSMIENFALVRTYHTLPWQPPSGDFVQLPLYETLRPLLEDFYQPPTDSQIAVEGASIRVMNGTQNPNWDRVAASRLGWDGLNAFAGGAADQTDYTETTLTDFTGQNKGSSRNEIAQILNIRPENIVISPDTNRDVDFEVVVGSNYNSCTFSVLPVEG